MLRGWVPMLLMFMFNIRTISGLLMFYVNGSTCHLVHSSILDETSVTATDYVLALATLGDTTQIGSFQSVSHWPRWPRQVQ